MKEGFRIIFMGTPEFAVPSLQVLVEHGFEVVAVITAVDKPKGRGQKVTPSPVKVYAQEQGIPILQPKNLKAPDFQKELSSYNANLQVVVAFRMLPEAVWNMPDIGTFNLHASCLPQYRGAAPINWAIINGETETGVTTFMIRHEIDTGSILFQEKEPIYPSDTAGTLYERLMNKGSQLVLKTVKQIASGEYQLHPQNESGMLKSAPKIHRETCQINWEQSAERIRNFVRGMCPYPAAWTTLNTKDGMKKCKVYKVTNTQKKDSGLAPGEYTTDNTQYIHIQTNDYLLAIENLQMEGRKRMPVADFLRGNTL